MKPESVAIVIAHFGSDEKLSRLLKSLGIVFPGSALQTQRSLFCATDFGGVYVVNNNLENRGFTAASNEGIELALRAGNEIIWLLNNDTVVEDLPTALTAFRKEFRENSKTGVIGCKILSLSDPDFIHHAGTTAVFPSGLHKFGRVSAGAYATRTKERWVTGASFLIPRRCLEQIGILDQNFFNYGSDSDFCYRARLAGFDVVYVPVPILHEIGESANPSPSQREILKNDMHYFQAKWISGEVFADLDTGVL